MRFVLIHGGFHGAWCIARLGVSPRTIEGSHSPFLSRPAQLACLLADAAATTPVGPLLPALCVTAPRPGPPGPGGGRARRRCRD